MQSHDAVIIGGGPAGLAAALLLGRQGRDVLMIDSGQYRNAPAKHFHMYLGFDGGSPANLRAQGSDEVAALDAVSRTAETVTNVETSTRHDSVLCTISDGSTIAASRLLLATGLQDTMSPIPGLDALFGDGVYHCPYCYGYENAGRKLAVLADNPTVPMQPTYQALYLATHFSDDVTLLTNNSDLPEKATPLLERFGVTVLNGSVTELRGVDGDITVTVDGTELHVGGVFNRPHESRRDDLAEQLGIELDGVHVLVDHQQRTSHRLVFAAGDTAKTRGSDVPLGYVAQAVAAGQAAGLWIDQDLFMDQIRTS